VSVVRAMVVRWMAAGVVMWELWLGGSRVIVTKKGFYSIETESRSRNLAHHDGLMSSLEAEQRHSVIESG
jgi:hypothetical protein